MATSLNLIPGPTDLSPAVLAAYGRQYDSPDLEESFFEEYLETGALLRQIVGAAPDVTVAIVSGEAMVTLWGALKSVIQAGKTTVVALATGLYGYGIGAMARDLGANVTVVGVEWDSMFASAEEAVRVIKTVRPNLVTVVHCETPSGTLVPEQIMKAVGEATKSVGGLLYVDMVSSVGAVPVRVSEWNIDLGLIGGQKALSIGSDISAVTVSPAAWNIINKVGYAGYDALLPWQSAAEKKYFPYTHNWRGVRALKVSCEAILKEGLDAVFKRHADVAEYTRQQLVSMGLTLFPKQTSWNSASVTAVRVPAGWTWVTLDQQLRKQKVKLGGNYGKLDGVVFRIGHMGTQARMEVVVAALEVLRRVLQSGPPRTTSSL